MLKLCKWLLILILKLINAAFLLPIKCMAAVVVIKDELKWPYMKLSFQQGSEESNLKMIIKHYIQKECW